MCIWTCVHLNIIDIFLALKLILVQLQSLLQITLLYKYHHSTKPYRKYHEFVAICVVTNAQHRQQTSDIFSGIAWYYGDIDFIIRTFDVIARSDEAHVTCSTWYGFSCDLQYWYEFSHDFL